MAALLGAALFVVYLSNVRMLSSGDNIPIRLLPFSLVAEFNLDLDEFPRSEGEDNSGFYYLRRENGHVYSGSPFLTSLLVSPLYLVPAWTLSAFDIPYDDVRAQLLFVCMERLAAASLTAFSAAVLFLVLCRLVSQRWAMALTLVYGLGTSTWRFSGQALWTHVLSELALVILCWIFLRKERNDEPAPAAFILAGLTVALAVANRPQTVIFALVTAAFVWKYHRRHLAAFAVLPIVGGAAIAAYNFSVFKSLVGAYGGAFSHFSAPLLTGVAGLLFSPNRGLLIFTPIFIFAVWGAVQVWRTEAHPWMRYMAVGLGLHILLYAKFDQWWAGYAFGPRYFTDVEPPLCLLLVYGLVPLCRMPALAALGAALALYGVAVQAIGVYCDDENWNRTPVLLEHSPERIWDWSDLHIVRAVQSGWHGGKLLPLVIGAFRDPVPARLRPGGEQPMIASILNRGARAWPAFAADYSTRGLVVLVVRWWANGQPVAGAGDVVKLPKNVGPGERVEVPLRLAAPAQPGSYEVELLVVQARNQGAGLSSGNSADLFRFPLEVG